MNLPNIGHWRLVPVVDLIELNPQVAELLPPLPAHQLGVLCPSVVSRGRMVVHASGFVVVSLNKVPVDVVCPLDRWLDYPVLEVYGEPADLDEILVD